MKTLYFLIIIGMGITIGVTGNFNQAYAPCPGGPEFNCGNYPEYILFDRPQIIDLKVFPSEVKVGDKFSITATLVNYSTLPIGLETGKCSIKDTEVAFFSVKFDDHVKIMTKNINCAGVGWSQILDPGKNITGTSPDYTINYTAIKSGITNATLTFSYFIKNQTDSTQPRIEQTISKSLLFTIHDKNIITESLNTGKHPVANKILSPLKQFKSGIAAKDVKCKQGLELLMKSHDNMPACIKSTSIQRLLGQGWINPYNFNGEYIGKESISLSAYQGVSNETFYNNGTVASDFIINVNIHNFKPSNASLVLQIYYNDGTLYKTVSVPSGMIQPDGFYKYHLIGISDENHPVPFKVVATYNNETVIAYAPVFAHP